MAYVLKDGQGSLFRNKEKVEATHADYTGQAKIAGVEYWLNAWIKDGKAGKFMSLSVRPKQARAAKAAPTQHADDPNDPIPF